MIDYCENKQFCRRKLFHTIFSEQNNQTSVNNKSQKKTTSTSTSTSITHNSMNSMNNSFQNCKNMCDICLLNNNKSQKTNLQIIEKKSVSYFLSVYLSVS